MATCKKTSAGLRLHRQAQKQHTLRRIMERCEIIITDEEYEGFCELIDNRDPRATWIENGKNFSSKWSIKTEQGELVAIWDDQTKRIATVYGFTAETQLSGDYS